MAVRRFMVSAVAAAGLGVLTAAGVAWGCAAWGTFERRAWSAQQVVAAGRFWMFAEFEGACVRRVTSWVFVGVRAPAGLAAADGGEGPPAEVAAHAAQRAAWVEARGEATEMTRWLDETSGWPRAALACESRIGATGLGSRVEEVAWGIRLNRREPAAAWNTQMRALPLRPVWGGLAVDAGLYGAAWYGVLVLPRAARGVRGWMRRRAGRCPECGYDLRGSGGSVCPECGGRHTGR